MGLSAFAEGWALHAERLAAELFRARRLVVDTGLHAKRWTRDEAIAHGVPAAEVERYVVFRGQACSYMIGELRLLVRDRMKDALGARFSSRDFHRLVLQTGTVPLDVLGHVVEAAIAAASATSPATR